MRLDEVRVLDLSRLLPGPYATQLLADAGADVVKIEDTDAGDYARIVPPYTDEGIGTLFDAVNRGKRSVAVDLTTDRGRDLFYRLVETADVVFEQFRPGVVDRLGVDYDTVCEHNPDVVYCSLSGYGQRGPAADRVGHDLNYVAMAGLLDMTRANATAPPQIPGYPIGDMAGGLFAAFSIVGALLSRELGATGGEYVDVAMTDVLASFSQSLANQALTGENPRPGETPLTGGMPWYDVYETADGRYLTIAALEPKFWRNFCAAVDREDLVDAHLTDDPAEREALRTELADIVAARTLAEWETALEDVDAMAAPVRTPAEALGDETAAPRDLVDESTGVPRVGFPAVSTAAPDGAVGDPPDHGEHTDEVLGAIGVGAAELDRLRADGVVE